jgi:hypothetical protein
MPTKPVRLARLVSFGGIKAHGIDGIRAKVCSLINK